MSLIYQYFDNTNVYSISFSLQPQSQEKLTRREFDTILRTFVGDSRQYRVDLETSIVHSRPIHIDDIHLKEFSTTSTKYIKLMLRCEQGCDVNVFLQDLLKAVNGHYSSPSSFSLVNTSVCRHQHCGIKDNSPLCVDREQVIQLCFIIDRDIQNLQYVHSQVAPWFVMNDITMLRHHCVAYFPSHSKAIVELVSTLEDFKQFCEAKSVAVTSNIQYFEHWQ